MKKKKGKKKRDRKSKYKLRVKWTMEGWALDSLNIEPGDEIHTNIRCKNCREEWGITIRHPGKFDDKLLLCPKGCNSKKEAEE